MELAAIVNANPGPYLDGGNIEAVLIMAQMNLGMSKAYQVKKMAEHLSTRATAS